MEFLEINMDNLMFIWFLFFIENLGWVLIICEESKYLWEIFVGLVMESVINK